MAGPWQRYHLIGFLPKGFKSVCPVCSSVCSLQGSGLQLINQRMRSETTVVDVFSLVADGEHGDGCVQFRI